MYVCLLKKPIELSHSTTYFAVFLISLENLTNVMGVHTGATRPKLTLYLPSAENMVA